MKKEKSGGWLLGEDEYGDQHIVPNGDVMEHTLENCWCKPKEEVLEEYDCEHKRILFTHNPIDDRE